MDVTGKKVLITGAASGLGAACARAMAAKGTQLALLDLNVEGLTAPDALMLRCDITKKDSLHRAFADLAAFGGADILIHCAGNAAMQPLGGVSVGDTLDRMTASVQINLTAALHIAALFVDQVGGSEAVQENAVMIFTASGAAFDGVPGAAAYSAAKGGIVSMTLAMAREMGPRGIRVNTISPGPMATPMLADVPEEYVAAIAAQTPFPGRPGRPEDFASLALHICENEHMNGAIVRLDGGHRTPYP